MCYMYDLCVHVHVFTHGVYHIEWDKIFHGLCYISWATQSSRAGGCVSQITAKCGGGSGVSPHAAGQRTQVTSCLCVHVWYICVYVCWAGNKAKKQAIHF